MPDVLEHLEHQLPGADGERDLPDEEGAGQVDEGEAVADQRAQADVEHGGEQHLRGRGGRGRDAGVGHVAVAEQQLVPDHKAGTVEHGLSPDVHVHAVSALLRRRVRVGGPSLPPPCPPSAGSGGSTGSGRVARGWSPRGPRAVPSAP